MSLTGGYLASAAGSVLGFAAGVGGTAAIMTGGDASRFLNYLTRDPLSLLEVEAAGVILALVVGVVGAPIGAGLALRLRGHPAAVLSGAWTFPLSGAAVGLGAWTGSYQEAVLPWVWLAGTFLAGLAARGVALVLTRRGTPPPAE